MNCSPIQKELIRKKLTNLQDDVSSLKQKFWSNRKSVDEYCHSRFYDELSALRRKKRSIYNLILGVLAANIHSRESSSRYPSELKPLLRQLYAVETDFQTLVTSLNAKDPLEHADGAIEGAYI
ncbi:unnamed protein product [Rodentolepis nana]|uniref:DUF4455 domain-containing protein n=1 Tax=Rodentolepis nana TaxID=102285 RepID=A0A0R3T065_RODNA|nr:unnamed protein product [Rodentolepis nana]